VDHAPFVLFNDWLIYLIDIDFIEKYVYLCSNLQVEKSFCPKKFCLQVSARRKIFLNNFLRIFYLQVTARKRNQKI